jgi:hypothetical protein
MQEIDQFWVLGQDVTLADGDEYWDPRVRTHDRLMNLTERIS